jgi:hypothetical protein
LDETTAEPDGDFSEAATSGDTCSVLETLREPFFVFRCRKASSVWSLIRIERFAGAISSVVDDALDLDRVCREGESS